MVIQQLKIYLANYLQNIPEIDQLILMDESSFLIS